MRALSVHTDFSAGILDQTMRGRTDTNAYNKGAASLENVLSLSQGGVRTRSGLRKVYEIPSGGQYGRLIKFEFSSDQVYLILLRALAIDVLSVTGELYATVTTTYTASEIAAIDFTQSLDTLILVHPDHAPAKLMRTGSNTSWAFSDLSLTNIPTYDFGDVAVTGTMTASVKTAGSTTTVTSSASVFTSSMVGWGISGNNGYVRITAYISASQITGTVISALDTTSAYSDWKLEAPSWSDTRGYPRSVFIHQGRLLFGGSKSRPQTMWLSGSNNFFDFKMTTSQLDDEAIEITLDNDRVCAIQQVYALNGFFAFTSGGIFAYSSNETITPKTFYLTRQSESSMSNVRPAELDTSVIAVGKEGEGHIQTVFEIQFVYDTQSWKPESLSLLASSIITGPVDMAARRGSEDDSAFLLFVVNSDGTVAVLNTRKSQGMTAWTVIKTEGDIKRVAVVNNIPFFLVRRTIGGADHYFIEKLTNGALLDCSVVKTSETEKIVWDGLDYLEGETVDIVGTDGAPLGSYTVSGGQIETEYAVSGIEVGFAFDWTVETMPIEVQMQSTGTLRGNRHRLTRAVIDVLNTASLAVNGYMVPWLTFGADNFGQQPALFSGEKIVSLLGWYGGARSKRASVKIEGQSSIPATILSVTAEVSD